MANSGNVIGQFKDEVIETTGEVVKDVKDAVGEMIEQGIQSTTSPQQIQPFDSAQGRQEDQKKELNRQKQIAYTRRWLQNLQMSQQKARLEAKQKEQQRLQSQQQEVQEKKVEKIQKQQASKKPGGTVQDAILRSQAEYKPGKGVGG